MRSPLSIINFQLSIRPKTAGRRPPLLHHHHEVLSQVEAEEVSYNIVGMNCSHCAESVRKAIASIPGVDNVEVSLREGKALVAGSPDEAEVLRAVESIGFKAAKTN